MLMCISPNGGVETTGSERLSRIKVATIGGIVTLERNAEADAWTETGRALQQLHLGSLLYEPLSGRLFAGAHGGGGLWMSEDGGPRWRQLTNGLPHPHIYSLQAQYREGRARLWVGAEPVSLFFSDDLGESWTERPSLKTVPENENWTFPPPPHVAHVKNVAWHDSAPDTIYVCVEQGALLRSHDSGVTWSEIKGYLIGDQEFYRDTHRLRIARSDPGRLYFATGDGLCRSLDGGETWAYLLDKDSPIGYPDAMFIDALDERKIVLGGPRGAPRTWRESKDAKATVLVSRDGGETFAAMTQGMGAPLRHNIEAMGMYSTPDHVWYAAGTAGGEVFLSEDGCETWIPIAQGLPPVSKAGHFRWFLSEQEREDIEERMRGWKRFAV